MNSNRPKLFISYKTTDVEIVRDVVEILRANKIETWFAEYSIGLDQWLSLTDEKIDDLLLSAVAASTHVLVFSSESWHTSKWCGAEHDHALAQHGVANVTVIRLAKSAADKKFEKPQHEVFDYRPTEIAALCRYLSQRLNVPIQIPQGPSPLGTTALLTSGRYAASLAVNPLAKFDYVFLRGLTGNVAGARLHCTFYFLPLRTTGGITGLEREQLTQRARDRAGKHDHDSMESDRVIYREYAQRAQLASRASGINDFGLHLIRYADEQDVPHGMEGSTGFAVSQIEESGPGRYALARSYSLRLDNGEGQPVGELMILFGASVRGTNEELAKLQLSLIAPYLDRVALSAQYHGSSLAIVGRRHMQNRIISLLLLAVLCFGGVHWSGWAQAFTTDWLIRGGLVFVGTAILLKLAKEVLTRRFLWPTCKIYVREDG